MNNLVDILNLCRICSSNGLHNIHSPIPFYLHTNTHQFTYWTKDIATLIEEVTGCKITADDGLPQKICTICISYLQHAVNFRQQMLNNINQISINLLNKTENLRYDNDDTTSQNILTDKCYPINETNINKETYDNLKAELDMFFNDNDLDTDDDDSDDEQPIDDINEFRRYKAMKSETMKTAIHSFFNYTEKPFEEDDLSDFSGIGVYQPEDFKERKCNACKRRFMLTESFDAHMKECIQLKLVNFINDCHQLLIIKKHKAISSSEFMRRMIFSLKNIVKSLALSYRHVTSKQLSNDTSLDVIKNNFNKINEQSPKSNLLKSMQRQSLPKKAKSPQLQEALYAFPNNIFKSLVKPSKNVIAKCSDCNTNFYDTNAFDAHNREIHGHSSTCSTESSEFDSQNNTNFLWTDDYSKEGIVNVTELLKRSPNVEKIEIKSNKM